jgi:type IV pilus assembly protein PilM
VHAGGTPRYVRMIPGVGGEAITQAVQQRYDWTWEEAERTKLFVGLPGHARMDVGQQESVGIGHDGLDHPAQKVIAASVESLVQEIVTTLDFYRSSTAEIADEGEPPAGIARLLLAGSGSRLGGLRELLEERLGLSIEPLDAHTRVKAPRKLRSHPSTPSLAVPAGLCVGAAR